MGVGPVGKKEKTHLSGGYLTYCSRIIQTKAGSLPTGKTPTGNPPNSVSPILQNMRTEWSNLQCPPSPQMIKKIQVFHQEVKGAPTWRSCRRMKCKEIRNKASSLKSTKCVQTLCVKGKLVHKRMRNKPKRI